jgi:CheY-like chemotaxis protein
MKMIDVLTSTVSGHRILIVEDEWLIAFDISDLLERWGCTVIGPASTVDEALALIRQDPPDAAVLDVHLKGETSEPVARALRAQGCPFVVLTAYRALDRNGSLDGAPLLRKPVEERRLLQELSGMVCGVAPG